MFCPKCGAQISGGSLICEKCGAALTSAPDYEYKTVRCYPSESTEERYREFYEACGWKITDMDRRQTFDGNKTYSTQTHIKLQRDKNMLYYDEIRDLSERAELYFDTKPNTKKLVFTFTVAAVSLLIALLLVGIYAIGGGADIFSYLPVFVCSAVSVLTLIIGVIRIRKNKKIKENYYESKRVADKAFRECKELVRQSKQY